MGLKFSAGEKTKAFSVEGVLRERHHGLVDRRRAHVFDFDFANTALIPAHVDRLRSPRLSFGYSYAASGRVIERGITPLVFFFLYTFFGAAAAAVALVVSGKAGALVSEFRTLQNDWIWLLVAVISSAAGGLLIYIAIGEKNATLASLIEISYPFFVALFAWVFFREIQFNWQTLVGGALILGGVAVVFFSERH
jgi:drug/metabolite transporter (DMT)-like permease